MKLLTDNAISSIEGDQFGFKSYACILKDTILETEPLPFCVGIFGSWGSGKTSFLKMIRSLIDAKQKIDDEHKIDNKPKVRTIWFDPWKYDKKDDLWSALIQTILSEISKEIVDPEMKDKAKRLALAAAWLGLKKAVNAVSTGIITESNLDEIYKAFTDKNEEFYRNINHFEDDFAKVVKSYTNKGKLVIFVDDLDRCLPENAITVLESLKLFIGHAHCIFVLGMDHYIVEEGIGLRYQFENKLELNGRDYLDKIIQVPFYLPPVPLEMLKSSLEKTLDSYLKKGSMSYSLSEGMWHLISIGMNGNPRKTKRFINCFILARRFLRPPTMKTVSQEKNVICSKEVQDTYLAKLLVFQMSFSKFYSYLRLHPDSWVYLETLVILEKSQDKQKMALVQNSDLADIWNKDLNLQHFMRETASNAGFNYPDPPPDHIVEMLLQATNLVTEIPGTDDESEQ